MSIAAQARFQHTPVVLAGVLFGCLVAAPAGAGDRKETTDLAIRGNAATLERFSPLSFSATVEEGVGGKKHTAHYWRSGDHWRMKVKGLSVGGGPLDIDLCSSGIELRSVTSRGSGGKTTALLTTARPIPKATAYDVWGAGLLSLATTKGALTLGEFLTQGEVLKAEPIGQERDADLLLRVKLGEETATLWVSPRYGFLVRKRSSDPDADERTEVEVTGFNEPTPGVFFPARVEAVRITKAGRTPIRTVIYSGVVLNKAHPPGTFVLKYPRGTWLFNESRNQTYETDEDGKPIGKARSVPETALLPVSPSENGVPPLKETKEEPESWTRIILPAAAVILLLAGLVWALRRRSASPT